MLHCGRVTKRGDRKAAPRIHFGNFSLVGGLFLRSRNGGRRGARKIGREFSRASGSTLFAHQPRLVALALQFFALAQRDGDRLGVRPAKSENIDSPLNFM